MVDLPLCNRARPFEAAEWEYLDRAPEDYATTPNKWLPTNSSLRHIRYRLLTAPLQMASGFRNSGRHVGISTGHENDSDVLAEAGFFAASPCCRLRRYTSRFLQVG